MHVNLLPTSFVWRRLINKRLRQWGWMFGLLTIVFLGWNAHMIAKWWNGLRELQAIFVIAEPIRALQSDRIQLAKQTIELQKKIQQLKSALPQDRTCSVLGIIAQGVHATKSEIQIQETQFSVTTKANDAANSTRESPRSATTQQNAAKDAIAFGTEYQLTIRGIAAEGESITEFVKSIQLTAAFPSVELRSTQERFVSERSLQEFQLECISHE